MRKDSEVVGTKVYHPGVGDFVTQEEFDRLQAEFNSPASIDRQVDEALKVSHEKVVAPPKAPKPETLLKFYCKENPRKPGKPGHKDLQMVVDNPGLTLDQLKKLGADIKHIKWDYKHGDVEGKP